MVRVKISNGQDPYKPETIIRYAEEAKTTLDIKNKECVIDLEIKHYLLVNGQEVYADLRYPDYLIPIKATNNEFIYVDENGNQSYKRNKDVYENGQIKEPYILGTNLFGQYDFFDALRKQAVIFDDIIIQQINECDIEGQFSGYGYVV